MKIHLNLQRRNFLVGIIVLQLRSDLKLLLSPPFKIYLMRFIFPFFILFLFSEKLVAQCLLPEVENLFITHESGCQRTLHWNAVDSASFYGVKYRLTSDTTSWILVPGGDTDTFYTFTGLRFDTSYTFAVSPVCADSVPAGWAKITDSNAVCEPPLNLSDSIDLDNMKLRFSWVTCWQSDHNQLRYKFINDQYWNYILTGTHQDATILLPANGTLLFQACSCPD